MQVCGHGTHGAFGDVRVGCGKADHPVLAKPRAKPVDQVGEGAGIATAAINTRLKCSLGFSERRTGRDRQADEIKTKARVDLAGEAAHAFGEQRAHGRAMAQWPTGTGGKMQHVAIDPEQRADDLPRAVAALLERAR